MSTCETYAAFSTFLHTSSSISTCSTKQFASFLSKFASKLDNIDDCNYDLLELLKRNISSFIYYFLYKNNNNNQKQLQDILSLFPKSVQKDSDPSIEPLKYFQNNKKSTHYYDLPKGLNFGYFFCRENF